MDIKKIVIQKANCSLDLGDGSERGFYVNQDYVLQKLHRIHRGISLMYTYYPNDKEWPNRVSSVYKDAKGAWDYPYEDYFPYRGGREGLRDEEPFNFMKDIRKHGQEVVLTLTIDPALKEEDIILIAKDLRPYGRILLRVNHECTGDWFCYTKRASYKQIADFFVLVCKVMHEYAPNVKMILCAGMFQKETGKLEMEDEFLEAHKVCDIWSCDNYLSLHWGWPHDIATKETKNYAAYNVDEIYQKYKATLKRLREITGQDKPIVISELNADGDVNGPFEQASYMKHFMELLRKDKEKWLDAFTLYQFRDDGRLGLECTDPNNKDVGIEQPMMKMYEQEIQKEFFRPKFAECGQIQLPVKLRWGSSEDAEGVEIGLQLKKQPHFFEVYFDSELQDLNMMIELNGYWFYKAKGIKCVDLMSYFFNNKIKKNQKVFIRYFCPPQDGVNVPEELDAYTAKDGDWLINNYTVLPKLPELRIEYEPISIYKSYKD